jgi:D-glycero-D-manno-heptose 1,7-bisphosphate phosphatase
MKKRAVFLDRDGVINDHVRYVNGPEDLILFPFAGQAIAKLNAADFLVFVVTNQGGVGLGYMTEDKLKRIHQKMIDELKKDGALIDDIVYCTHKPQSNCICRKPSPHMILQLADTYEVDLESSYMVGDRETDVEAGQKAGTKTVLIGTGARHTNADHWSSNLMDAVEWIVMESQVSDSTVRR